MDNTMKEVFASMSPEELRLQNIQSLIASLVFGRFVCDGGVSRAARFTEGYLKKWDEFENGKPGQRGGISSPGFGFFQETAEQLRSVGFDISKKNIGVQVSRAWRDEEALTQRQIDKCGEEIVDHFSGFGIRCKAVAGGEFPNETTAVAVVFDVHDPEFLTKIKPDFLKQFVLHEAQQMATPNHNSNQETLQTYVHEMTRCLFEYADQNNFALNVDLPTVENDTPEYATSQAEYKMNFFTGGMDVMIPVLTLEEKQSIILSIVDRIVCSAPDMKPFNNIRRLALR